MATLTPTRSQTERAEPTRVRILDAAIRAFSENGLAGARTEQIAEEAGVNKALLYYYFKGKDDLYAAALEQVIESVRAESASVLETNASAGERFVQIVLGNFDRAHSHPAMRSMIQQEMVRLHRGEENRMASMAEKFFRPLVVMVDRLLEEGISSGELVRVDPAQMRYAALGANVFYFLSAPLISWPWAVTRWSRANSKRAAKPPSSTWDRPSSLDREHGARVAARVLARTPMPDTAATGNCHQTWQ